jgi:hypothetical protein
VGPLVAFGSASTLSAGRDVLLVLAGLGAGVLNGVAGGGTLISFPVLLAMGVPALSANVTSSVGIWPGYLGALGGFRADLEGQRPAMTLLAPVAFAGALAGSILLLTTSSATFADLAPWLVLFASMLYALQPLLVRALGGATEHGTRRALLLIGTGAAALYGGYFGAGMGIMLLAVLGLGLPDTLARTGGMRTILSILVNGVAAIVFLVHGNLVWEAVACLAPSAALGGYLGARLVKRLPAPLFRVLVACVGVSTAIKLLVG